MEAAIRGLSLANYYTLYISLHSPIWRFSAIANVDLTSSLSETYIAVIPRCLSQGLFLTGQNVLCYAKNSTN